ncbi:hypothetical protein KP696_16835 [Nocardia seriolae]|nr:hypothetical protein NS14008_37635 [Nocardia seriolae]PSK28541.1 hypothetical protein C6575_25850 [Nocardia seriolae]QOW37629.1 hypothetical protein IMZ23_32375 [Nocardia seriolae]QUN21403.1 hypothetical protein KEC46_13435 [Nocardia seriolae]RLP25130.1 hypothetical protein D6158_32360 [Nocardia seriolae]
MALGLAGCGSDKSGDANGLKQASSTTARTTGAVASTTAAGAPIEPPTGAPAGTTVAKKTSAPNGAQTTCGDFRDLTDDVEKQVIDQILAAHPGSFLEGNANMALGTAKLACLSTTYTNTPVAVAIRVAAK